MIGVLPFLFGMLIEGRRTVVRVLVWAAFGYGLVVGPLALAVVAAVAWALCERRWHMADLWVESYPYDETGVRR